MNNVTLTGRLTKAPTLTYTAHKGTPVASLRLAVNDYDGRQRVDFFDVQVFGARATAAAEHLTKGRMVEVVGALRLDEWTDKQTEQRRSRVYINANRLEFLPDGRANGRSDGPDPDGADEPDRDDEPDGPADPAEEPF
jgi:single-strand DNA-binding protein